MDEYTKQLLNSLEKASGEEEKHGGQPRILSVHFGRKDLMYEGVSGVYSNWSSDFTSACFNSNIFAIDKAAIKSVEELGACAYGHIIVKCDHY